MTASLHTSYSDTTAPILLPLAPSAALASGQVVMVMLRATFLVHWQTSGMPYALRSFADVYHICIFLRLCNKSSKYLLRSSNTVHAKLISRTLTLTPT